MPTCATKRKPAIHCMVAPGKPAAIIVKTWNLDGPGSRAVVAKIFRIPECNADAFASELETLLARMPAREK